MYGPFNKMEFAAAPPVVFLEDRTSCQFLEDKDEVGSHDMVLDKLVTVALSAGESAELLADLADEARQDPSEEAPDGSIDSGSPLMA